MAQIQAGDRVRITALAPDDPHPLPVGSEGTVLAPINQAGQILVEWDPDVGRTLILLEHDPFEVI